MIKSLNPFLEASGSAALTNGGSPFSIVPDGAFKTVQGPKVVRARRCGEIASQVSNENLVLDSSAGRCP